MKKFFLFTIVLSLGFLPGLILSKETISFESLESITESGNPVYNEIKFMPGWNQDVWMMRQSHHGYSSDHDSWDRLAIFVDKVNKKALFYQLKSGKMNVIESIGPQEAEPLKARCLACHSNGPRAVRINTASKILGVSMRDQVRVFFWNLRIKTYGRLKSEAGLELASGVPFPSKLEILSRPLNLSSCTGCHSESGIRNPLTLGQLGTVNFMIKNRFMPPFPFQVSPEDVKTVSNLIKD